MRVISRDDLRLDAILFQFLILEKFICVCNLFLGFFIGRLNGRSFVHTVRDLCFILFHQMRPTRLALGGTLIFPSSPTRLQRIREGLLALFLAYISALLGSQSEDAP